MPCSDGGYPDDTIVRMQARLDAATAAACEAMAMLHSLNRDGVILPRLSSTTREWYKAHQAADAARLKREQAEAERVRAKAEALAKLTDAERKLLGLKK